MRTMRRYSNEEVEFLKNNYYDTPVAELSEKLSRSEGSIKNKARRLDLVEEDNGVRRRARIVETPEFKDENLNNFISGYVSGEGSFSRRSGSGGNRFELYVSTEDKDLVKEFYEYFNKSGTLHTSDRTGSNKTMIHWQISSIPEIISVVIPFFENVDMRNSNKEKQYREWKNEIINDYNIEDILDQKV